MPSKKKKYNARFPPARIKKIMQTDEEVGKVAAAVPVIISRALELFVETLVKNASSVTTSRNAKTLTTSHIKACVLAEENFKFLKGLVQDIPDVMFEEEPSNSCTVPVLEGQVSVQNSIHQNCARRGRPPKIKTEPDGAGPSRSTADESETWSAEDDAEEGSTESSSETTSDHRVVSSSSIPPTYSPSYVPGVHHNFHPHQVACSTTSSADEDCDL